MIRNKYFKLFAKLVLAIMIIGALMYFFCLDLMPRLFLAQLSLAGPTPATMILFGAGVLAIAAFLNYKRKCQ